MKGSTSRVGQITECWEPRRLTVFFCDHSIGEELQDHRWRGDEFRARRVTTCHISFYFDYAHCLKRRASRARSGLKCKTDLPD
jgi:hypothetical protein